MRIVNTNIPIDELDDVDRLEPDTYPTGTGRLTRMNGAVTMNHDGPFHVHAYRKGWTDEDTISLELYDEDTGLEGDIEFEPEEAARLAIELLANADPEFE